MAYGTVNADVISTSVANTSLGAGNATVFKNRIINGNMVIDQRNAGASVTPTTGVYLLDRWQIETSQNSKFTYGQNLNSVTPPTGYINYLGCQTASAYSVGATDYFLLEQKIEGLNISDLAWGTANAKTITLSFQVYSSLTGTFGGNLQNSAANRLYPFSYTVSTANTWTQVSVTIAGDTSGTWLTTNGIGINVRWSLGTGSTYLGTAGAWGSTVYLGVTGQQQVVGTASATFYITGVQLEVGSSATGFEYNDYGRQLIQCQRYFQKFQGVGPDDNWASGIAYTTALGICPFTWSPPLRTSATITTSGSFEAIGGGVVAAATLGFTDITPFSGQLAATTSSLLAGGGCLVRTASGTASISVSAEL